MKLTVTELSDAHRVRNDIYAQPGGSAGCCWHIVLDDHNLDDDSVAFCVDRAAEAAHPTCVALGPFVLRMSATQRAKLVHGGYHTHRRALVAELQRVGPHYVHLGVVDPPATLDAWMTEPIVTRPLDEIAEESHTRFKAIQKILNKRRIEN